MTNNCTKFYNIKCIKYCKTKIKYKIDKKQSANAKITKIYLKKLNTYFSVNVEIKKEKKGKENVFILIILK